MAEKSKKTILIHHVFIPSKLTDTSDVNWDIDQMLRYVEVYQEKFAFNIDGLIEKFIPSFERSEIEVFNLEDEYE